MTDARLVDPAVGRLPAGGSEPMMPGVVPERRTTDGIEATIHVVAAQRVAQAAVTGFGFCEEGGHPLTERQKVAILTAAMLELDGLHEEVEGVVRVERLVSELRGLDRS